MVEYIRDKYKLIRKVGSGGMAEIYLAHERDTGKSVAIKILHPDRKNSYADRRRFQHEIELMKKVESPYVVKIYDWEWNDNIQYIVMEYIDGETLKEYIQKKGKVTVDETVEYTKQIALGFDAIHRVGIVHRDIKSTNIIVTELGQVKIIDFGIAITEESERLTKTDNIIASPQYIAPELIEQKPPTKKSDIYSLGILMYEMLTGNVPFSGKTAYDTVRKHQTSQVPHVNKVYDYIPQSLANVIIKSTAKKAEKRYDTMYELYKDVLTCLDSSRAYEEVINLTTKKKKNFFSIMNSKWMLVGILSFIFVALILVIAILAVKVF